MYNRADDEDFHDYAPNELARMSMTDPDRYREIVESNLEEGDTIERWHNRNKERAAQYIAEQKAGQWGLRRQTG